MSAMTGAQNPNLKADVCICEGHPHNADHCTTSQYGTWLHANLSMR
ncbi:hypothetical protein [Candidatus Nitrotoga sp. M5]|nr:hypothetical protein [Candidatus Nitrotoga sp. M5]